MKKAKKILLILLAVISISNTYLTTVTVPQETESYSFLTEEDIEN